MKWICFLLSLLVCTCEALIIPQNLVPTTNLVPWQGICGVPGGVTNRTVIFANVRNAPYNAFGDGVHDDTAAIQAALDACVAHPEQIVYIPAGTYNVTAIYIKGSYTVRGDGPTTVINGQNAPGQYSTVYFGDGSGYNWAAWGGQGTDVSAATTILAGATNHSSTLVVSSASGMSVGKFLYLDCLDDGGTNWTPSALVNKCGSENNSCTRATGRFDPTKTFTVDGSQRNRNLIVQITGVSGTTITVSPVVPMDLPLSPTASAFSIPTTGAGVQYGGLENLKVQQNNNGHNSAIVMWRCAFCWVKGIEVSYPDGDFIQASSCFRCEYRDSYFHDGWDHGPGGSDDCVRLTQSTSFHLIENNIIRRSHEGVMLDFCGSCHVVAYNFITNNFDVNCLDCMLANLDYHGSHVAMVLWEGNVVNMFNQDGGWGSGSHGTVLRNFLSGDNWVNPPFTGSGPETGPATHPAQYHWCLNLANNSKYFNVVGNVMGGSGMTNVNGFNPIYTNVWPTMIPGYAYGIMMRMGYGAGNDTGTDPMDNTYPFTTLINHGNWDILNQKQVFDPTISDHAIPQSYYLGSKPLFFGLMAWPPIDPTTGNTNFALALIPAQYRWFYGTNPPSSNPIPTTQFNLVSDTPITGINSLLTTSGAHIKNQGAWQGFAVRLNSNLGNDAGLFLYRNRGAFASLIPLVPGMYTNVGVQSDIAIFGQNAVIAGGSPIGLPGSIYEFALGPQMPLPTTFTLTTNFHVGDNQASHVNVVTHSGGGIAVFFSSNSNALWTCYRFPNGTWTNYGSVALPGIPNAMAFLTAAEMPADHSIWVWGNNDASGKMTAVQFLTNAVGLVTNKAFQYIDNSFTGGVPTWGLESPYGEIVNPMEAISDSFHNSIELAYNQNNYIQSGTDYFTRVTPAVVARFNANTNHFAYGSSSNNMIRLGGLLGVTQVGGFTYLTVQADTTNSETSVSTPAVGFPVYFQAITDSTKCAPSSIVWSNYTLNSYFAYRADAGDFVARYPDLSWHLLSFDLPPIVNNVNVQFLGQTKVLGNVLIK